MLGSRGGARRSGTPSTVYPFLLLGAILGSEEFFVEKDEPF